MRRSIQALCVTVALAGVASAQHKGDIPPALVWDKLKGNCPASLDWASLYGKVVVVSFSPDDVFQDDIDDWKQAAQTFQGELVQLLQVVAGSEFLLDQALQQTGFHGCVLLDSDLRDVKNFRLPRLRRTVVVDPQGFVAGYARSPDDGDVKDAVRAGADRDWIASRGEHFSARIMAAFLGGTFVEAEGAVFLTSNGLVDDRTWKELPARLPAQGFYVLPGFYGTGPQGKVKTFSGWQMRRAPGWRPRCPP